MRARRLRRLGLIGSETMVEINSTTTTTPAVSGSSEICLQTEPQHSIGAEVDAEENQHKLKQQKFDNESNMEVGYNNNLAIQPAAPASSTQSLTQRSRLLDEIEKQRMENNLNQNLIDVNSASTVIAPSDKIDVRMDVTESPVKMAKPIAVEAMDIDESTPPGETIKTVSIETQLSDVQKRHEAEVSMSRILDAVWTDRCEGRNKVSTELCDFYKKFIVGDSLHFSDWAFQIIIDMIAQYFDGRLIDFKSSRSSEPDLLTINVSPNTTGTADHMDTGECSTPTMMPHNLPAQGALAFLTQSYFRSWRESDRYKTPKNVQKYGDSVTSTIETVRKQIILGAKLLLDGTIALDEGGANTHRSVLLNLLYEEAVPLDFLCLLVEQTYQDAKAFDKIFGTLIRNLYNDMQSRVTGKHIDMASINILRQLIEITVAGNTHPITNLIVGLANFSPKLCTLAPGREIVKASYLGPFFSISVFSEENVKLAEDIDENWESTFGKSLQMVSTKTAFHTSNLLTPKKMQLIRFYLSTAIGSNA